MLDFQTVRFRNATLMPIPLASKVTVRAGVLMEELEGGSVCLNLKTGIYFGLDEVATSMMKALTTADSIQSAFDSLVSAYDVDAASLRQDLQELIEKLVEHGILQIQ